MRHVGAQARAMFDRLFPERQIMHRSCGAVRGLRLSPGRQALVSLGAVGVAGWCVYATATTVLEGPCPPVVAQFASERANYQRWLDDFRDRAVASRETLEDVTRKFDDAQRSVETRHDVLRALLEYARGSRLRPPARGDGGVFAAITDPEAGVRVEPVSLSARLEGMLGPAPASAAEPSAAAPHDFVAAVRDPLVAERVSEIAGRVAAFRRMAAQYR